MTKENITMTVDRRQVSRRGFMQTAALTAGALSAADPIRASAPAADIKIGLYSITYGGVWYRGGALSTEAGHPARQEVRLPGRGDRREAPPRQPARHAEGPLPAAPENGCRSGTRDLRGGRQQRFQQPHPGTPRNPIGLPPGVDANDGGSGREGHARFPRPGRASR